MLRHLRIGIIGMTLAASACVYGANGSDVNDLTRSEIKTITRNGVTLPVVDLDQWGRIITMNTTRHTVVIQYGPTGRDKYPSAYKFDDGPWVPVVPAYIFGGQRVEQVMRPATPSGVVPKIQEVDYTEWIQVIGEIRGSVADSWVGYDYYYGGPPQGGLTRAERMQACKDICDDTAIAAGLLCIPMGMANPTAGALCAAAVVAAQFECRARCDAMP
ncbi:MAG: hypothetical protein IT522_08305 [Burkholderiales bacterium]|nr:hypothetical protein [Burkholderiales bacterium]